MIYKDQDSNPKQLAILVFSASVIYFLCLRLPVAGEVSSFVGLVAEKLISGSAIDEMSSLMDNLHESCYPLKVFLVSFFSSFLGGITDVSLRVPAFLSCVAIGLCTARISLRLFGVNTFLIVLAAIVTMPLSIKVVFGADGSGVFALLLGGAWWVWFYYGWQRNCWGKAWFFSLALVTVAVFERGLLAYLYFYLPLMFLRNPIRSRVCMNQPLHLLWLGLSFALFSVWYSVIAPDTLPLVEVVSTLAGAVNVGETYFSRLFVFPLLFILLLLPWPIITWPAYCAEFQMLERHPEIMHYLRTIVLSVFLFNWLLPVFDITDLYLIVPPIALLSACHYEVLMRRYRPIYMLCAKIVYVTAAIAACLLAGWLMLNLYGVIGIENLDLQLSMLVIYIPPVVLAAIYLFRKLKSFFPVWLHLSVAVCLVFAVCISAWGVLEEAKYDFRKGVVQQLTSNVPAGENVYIINSYSMCKYTVLFDPPVKLLHSTSSIPSKQEGIYVLGEAKPPIQQDREWNAISPQVSIPSRLRWQASKKSSEPLWFHLELKGEYYDEAVVRKVRMYKVTPEAEE